MSAATPTTALAMLQKHQSRDHQATIRTIRTTSQQIPALPLPQKPSLSLLQLPLRSNKDDDVNDDDEHEAKKHEANWLHFNKCNGNGITEISGEAGSGKTQLCLSLCVSCAMTTTVPMAILDQTTPSFYHSMYITLGSEGDQSQKIAYRLHQMIQHRIATLLFGRKQLHQNGHNFYSASTSTSNNSTSSNHIREVLKRIHTKHVHNEEDLMELIQNVLPRIFQKQNHQQQPIGVLVLDSIAGIFRTNEENNGNMLPNTKSQSSSYYYAKRSEKLFTISSQLKSLSDIYNVHILIVNQVTASIEQQYIPTSSHNRTMVEKGSTKPSLGLSWSYCVNDRYIISKSTATTTSTSHGTKCVRTLELYTSSMFSAHEKRAKFTIQPHFDATIQ